MLRSTVLDRFSCRCTLRPSTIICTRYERNCILLWFVFFVCKY